jgi:hypothetical protein
MNIVTSPREGGRHSHARAPHHPFRRGLGLVAAVARDLRLRPSRRRDARPAHARRRHRLGRTGRAVARISPALVAVARHRSGHRRGRLPRHLPDLRGAGWTVADDPRIERESRLRDLLAPFDALHIERAHLVSINAADHAAGLSSSLDNLAASVEPQRRRPRSHLLVATATIGVVATDGQIYGHQLRQAGTTRARIGILPGIRDVCAPCSRDA